jgi:hypothetical protein
MGEQLDKVTRHLKIEVATLHSKEIKLDVHCNFQGWWKEQLANSTLKLCLEVQFGHP